VFAVCEYLHIRIPFNRIASAFVPVIANGCGKKAKSYANQSLSLPRSLLVHKIHRRQPFEIFRIRVQDIAQAHKDSGMIISQERILTLYQRLKSIMWRHIFWNAGCISQVYALLPQGKGQDHKRQSSQEPLEAP